MWQNALSYLALWTSVVSCNVLCCNDLWFQVLWCFLMSYHDVLWYPVIDIMSWDVWNVLLYLVIMYFHVIKCHVIKCQVIKCMITKFHVKNFMKWPCTVRSNEQIWISLQWWPPAVTSRLGQDQSWWATRSDVWKGRGSSCPMSGWGRGLAHIVKQTKQRLVCMSVILSTGVWCHFMSCPLIHRERMMSLPVWS